jgi:hypothetical protein
MVVFGHPALEGANRQNHHTHMCMRWRSLPGWWNALQLNKCTQTHIGAEIAKMKGMASGFESRDFRGNWPSFAAS